jgi:bacterioferritin-associated ferredoxin
MFVCLCNGFTERQVRECLKTTGVQSVAGVYRCLGKPQCGKCIGHVRQMVDAAHSERCRHAGAAEHLPAAAAAVRA